MVILGVALLTISMLLVLFIGDLFGIIIGVDFNVGGVGIGMIILVLSVDYLMKRDKLSEPA